MRKILSGMLGLVMVASVVGGVAYAAFSSTASVEGISFSSGDADLRVWDGDSYEPTFTSNWTFSGLLPGSTGTPQSFWLKNTSSTALTFNLTAKLRDGVVGDWDDFKANVSVAIADFGATPTEWYTLEQWNAGAGAFQSGSNTSLDQNEEQQYTMHVQVNPLAGNEFENKTLSSVEFDFTGTQP